MGLPGLTRVQADKRYATRATLSALPGFVPASDRNTIQRVTVLTATASDYLVIHHKTRHVNGRPVKGIRLVYTGWSWDDISKTEKDHENAVGYRVGIELADGTFYPARFTGARDATLNPGAALVSDLIPVYLARGDVYFVRTRTTVTQGQVTVCNVNIDGTIRAGEGQERATGVDKTTSGTIAVPSSPSTRAAVAPNFVLGVPTTSDPLVGVVGDSISSGWLDATQDYGYWSRAMSGKLGFSRVSSSGESMAGFRSQLTTDRRRAWLPGITHAVVALGTNDARTGGTGLAASLATMQANAQAIWAYIASLGATVTACTLPPRTDSTDAWATTVNQTPDANNAARVAYNNWLRTLPAPLVAVHDVADVCETARNSGLWVPGHTTDGLHPDAYLHGLMAAAVNLGALGYVG